MAGIIGKGTTLGAAATSTTVVLAGLMDCKQPKPSYAKVDVTEYADAIEQYIPGWLNAGEVEFEIGFSKTQKPAITALLGVVNTFWKITYPDGSTEAFQGWLMEISGEIPLKGKIICKAKICVTTVVTFVAGS